MSKYKEIVLDGLKITDQFLLEDERSATIHERLKSACQVIKDDKPDSFSNRDIFAINQCVHLATSIVLLGTVADQLQETMNKTKDEFPNSDPTSVITIATLYYLLVDYMKRQDAKMKEIREKLDRKESTKGDIVNWQEIVLCIRKRFDAVNWMIGHDGMKKLDIEIVQVP